jgi:hypothetical protein
MSLGNMKIRGRERTVHQFSKKSAVFLTKPGNFSIKIFQIIGINVGGMVIIKRVILRMEN